MRRADIALLLAIALTGCGQPAAKPPKEMTAAAKPATPPPTAAEAQTIVADSPDFGEYEFTNAAWTLPMSRAAMNAPAAEAAADLRRAGWISFSGDAVVLTSKAKNDKRFVVRPNGFTDVVPLAKKEFVSVDAVKPNSDGSVAVDFTWRWLPNDVGAAFRSGLVHDRFEGQQKTTATIVRSGGAWMILRFRSR